MMKTGNTLEKLNKDVGEVMEEETDRCEVADN